MTLLPQKMKLAGYKTAMTGKVCAFLSLHASLSCVLVLPSSVCVPARVDFTMLCVRVQWHCGARSEANLPINRGFDHHFGFLKG